LEERISKLESMGERVKIFWAKDLLGEQFMHINSFDPLLKHKTTARKLYDLCWRKAEVCGGFDGLFLNEKGEITEGGRSNVFIRIEGSLYTPPVKCGLLPGIMREIVLKDPAYSAHEAVLSAKDVREAEEIYLTNSLRGIFKVSLAPINN
jgi:para-aminobenzoate synthetase/4-amino-4-deoxychorismate lyase